MNVSALEWVVDGVEIVEAGVIEDLSYVSNDDPEIVDVILSLAWMQDGVYRTEAEAVEKLSYMADDSPAGVMRIARMPFLVSVEAPGVSALLSLVRLAERNREWFSTIMSYPSLRDGITDDLAPWFQCCTACRGTILTLSAYCSTPRPYSWSDAQLSFLCSEKWSSPSSTPCRELRKRWTFWSTPCVESRNTWASRFRRITSACCMRTR